MIRLFVPALAAAVAVSTAGTAQAASPEPVPAVMAALGDSISAGYNACGWYVACTSRSWSTGDHADVRSHYRRLLAIGAAVKGHNRNLAKPGATSRDLRGQVARAVEEEADYVTILIGAQDACVGTEQDMTPVATFRSRIETALADLRAGRPQAKVFIASIPDLKRLWRVGKESFLARTFWSLGRICPSMLAEPTSGAAKDRQRRDRVRARVTAYNEQLRAACAAYGANCRHDGGALFTYPYTLKHISGWDYFHPNTVGQQVIARLTFAAAGWWDRDRPVRSDQPLLHP
jgi:lysophospholipase L1-like esterase